jgi:hypothetical protein
MLIAGHQSPSHAARDTRLRIAVAYAMVGDSLPEYGEGVAAPLERRKVKCIGAAQSTP